MPSTGINALQLETPPQASTQTVNHVVLDDPALPALSELSNRRDERSGSERFRPAESSDAEGDREQAELLPESEYVPSENGSLDAAVEQVRLEKLHTELKIARRQRRAGNYEIAQRMLSFLLERRNVPEPLKRSALLEMALVAEDAGEWVQAQRWFARYTTLYRDHPSVPEVLLRQGLLYRRMGATGLALAKFVAVMGSSLTLDPGELEHYERVVLLAQSEAAETYYLHGQYSKAAEAFRRLLKRRSALLSREHVQYKLILCLQRMGNVGGTIQEAEQFVERYPEATTLPEVRFLLATAYRQAGRKTDARREVVTLLQVEAAQSAQDPVSWAYWQKRAGNEVANQFYQEGDFPSALTLYRHLAEVDSSPAWQLPVLYQLGIVYERLLQPERAMASYTRIVDREKELSGTNLTPSLESVIEMAHWRKEALAWMEKARAQVLALKRETESTP